MIERNNSNLVGGWLDLVKAHEVQSELVRP